ncbi:MAG TPA: MBL fold metallo-hydrolase [Actinomycetota bacterium]|nr:MBL fold metallo-hydrolase [Actinomycetota bacterium]
MELTILGTSGGYAAPGTACSGYLLRAEGFALVLDLGNGALSNLLRHVPHERVDAVVLTHRHPDHVVDLFPLLLARSFHPEPLPPLPVLAGPGALDRVARLEDPEGRAALARRVEGRDLVPGETVELGPFRLEARPLPHWVPNLGVRVEADGAVLAYTGDTGPSDELVALARGADLLLAEASWLDDQAEGREPFHLTAGEAAEAARRAGVRRLVLTHFWPTNPRERSLEEAAGVFEGPILLAEEGLALDVGRG